MDKKEQPYAIMTDDDKKNLKYIGTSLNNAIRSGCELSESMYAEKERFDRLIQGNVLKEDVVVYRGATCQEYEASLARERGYSDEYLYYDGYVYCALSRGYYFNSSVRMIITVPAGTHYLYTGEYSNTPDTDEFVLGIGTGLKINKEERVNDCTYLWLTVV